MSAPSRRLGEQAMDAISNAAHDRIEILDEVRRGLRSVRNASLALNWTDEEVQMAVWGEVRQ